MNGTQAHADLAAQRARNAAHPRAAMIVAMGRAMHVADDATYDVARGAHRFACNLLDWTYCPGVTPAMDRILPADWAAMEALAAHLGVDVPAAA